VTRRAHRLAILLIALAFGHPPAFGEPPQSIFGVYARNSKTCGGGPGLADGGSITDCRLVYEDRLEIGPSLDFNPTPNEVFVELGFHFGHSDYCAFRGHGTWSKGKVVLNKSEKPLDAPCRLEVMLLQGAVRLSDHKRDCSVTLCTVPQKLHGVTYKKQ
jgi:hypothetical protein